MEGLTPEFRQYKRQLKAISDRAFPEVVAATLNNVSKYADLKQKQSLRRHFTLRNRYTERSLKRWPAKPKKPYYRINSVLGSISPYMDLHESGGVRYPKKGNKVAMPTLAARGGSRKRTVRRKYYAGRYGEDIFIGKPKGGRGISGIYERRKGRLKMIKSLEHSSINIRETRWHSSAVKRYARRDFIQHSFVKAARRYIENGPT